jgi:hypothetical protein
MKYAWAPGFVLWSTLANAQARCTDEGSANLIDDARNSIFTRSANTDYEVAARNLRRALQQCPNDPEVHALLGIALLGMQDFVPAEVHLQAALTWHRDDAWWRGNRAFVEAQLTQLRTRLGSLVVTTQAPGAILHLGDTRNVVLPTTEPIRVNTGHFTLRLSAAGFEDMTREVEVNPEQVTRIQVEMTPQPAPTPTTIVRVRESTLREVRSPSALRVTGYSMFSVGVVSSAVGIWQWFASSDQMERARDATGASPEPYGAWARFSVSRGVSSVEGACELAASPSDVTSAQVNSLCSDNQRTKVMAWIFTVAGVALVGGGAALAIVARDPIARERVMSQWTVTPALNGRGVSLTVRF